MIRKRWRVEELFDPEYPFRFTPIGGRHWTAAGAAAEADWWNKHRVTSTVLGRHWHVFTVRYEGDR